MSVSKKVGIYILTCIALGIFSMLLMSFNIFEFTGAVLIVSSLAMGVLNGVVVTFMPKWVVEPEKTRVCRVSDDAMEDVTSLIDVRAGLRELDIVTCYIQDSSIKELLNTVVETASRIIARLDSENDSQRTRETVQFFEYYIPATIKLAKSLSNIERSGSTNNNSTEMMNRIEGVLPRVLLAFEKKLDSLLSDERSDISSEIDVLESMLSLENLS